MIGDDDPADGYDRGDRISTRLAVIARVAAAARDRRDHVELAVLRGLLDETVADLRRIAAPGDL